MGWVLNSRLVIQQPTTVWGPTIRLPWKATGSVPVALDGTATEQEVATAELTVTTPVALDGTTTQAEDLVGALDAWVVLTAAPVESESATAALDVGVSLEGVAYEAEHAVAALTVPGTGGPLIVVRRGPRAHRGRR